MSERDTRRLRPRKEPQQERSRFLVEAILEAATRIVVEEGSTAFTLPAVCARAGVSPGSFYQYFPNKEAVLYALLRRHAEEVTTGLLAVLAMAPTASTTDIVSDAVDAFLEAHRREPELHACLGTFVAQQAGPGLEADLLQRLEDGLTGLIGSRRDELRGRDPRVLAFLTMRTLESNVHAAARDRPELLDDPAFRDGLIAALLGVLA